MPTRPLEEKTEANGPRTGSCERVTGGPATASIGAFRDKVEALPCRCNGRFTENVHSCYRSSPTSSGTSRSKSASPVPSSTLKIGDGSRPADETLLRWTEHFADAGIDVAIVKNVSH
ncbi:hypothetical protein [Natrinema sp. SYSU A 869]|uniref:hypothetical protein n=1 Tax=Natrinema sp. SYSU A 869 TaxID=2871694 RepID=UPI001CA3B68E|nr:hypothetical protein [Natrinema sp. SYSU A 869]